MTFPELHGLLDYYFFQDYNLRPHPAHDYAPIDYMNRRLGETGRRLARRAQFDEQFYIRTCIPPSKSGSTRVLDKVRGVKIAHIWYTCEEFSSGDLKDGEVLDILIDMWDVSIAYALVRGVWVRCVSRLLMKYRKLSSIEWRYVIYEVRLRNDGVGEGDIDQALSEILQDTSQEASLAEATRQVYGDVRQAAEQRPLTTDQIIAMPIAQPEAEGKSVEDTSSAIFREPVTKLPVEEERTNPNSAKHTFNLDYDRLPTRGPIQTGADDDNQS